MMTINDLNKVYGSEKVEEALAMMGAGWSTEDTVKDIARAHESVTEEEAEELLEIIKEAEEIMGEEEKNMKGLYILMDCKGGDIFTETFDNEADAIKAGESKWNHLTEHDKKYRSAFYVLRSIADDIDAENSFDGDVVKEWK